MQRHHLRTTSTLRPARRSRRRAGASIVEVLVVIAVLVLGLVVGMRALQGDVHGGAGRVGDAVVQMSALDQGAAPDGLDALDDQAAPPGANGDDTAPTPPPGDAAGPIAMIPVALRTPGGPEPSPSPGPAPSPPSATGSDPISDYWDEFTGLWENGLWDEEKCRDFWSLDCLREYGMKGALSNVSNSLRAVWDTGAELVTGVGDLLGQWWDDPASIVTQPIENAQACFGDLLGCGGSILEGALETVWDDTSAQLFRDRDYSGVIGRTGAKIGLIVAGPALVKTGLKVLRGIFGRGGHDGVDESPDADGGGGSGGNGGTGPAAGSGAAGDGSAGSGGSGPAAGSGAAGSGSPGSASPLPRGNPDPNARARGARETDPRATRQKQEDLDAQNDDADNLARAGYDIANNDQGLRNEHGREPDYIIDGEFADHAHIRSGNVEQARKAIRGKVPTQATRIVVRIHPDSGLTVADIEAILRRKPIPELDEVIFVENGVVVSTYTP